MSHIAYQKTKPGDPMFKDTAALQMACAMLGLNLEQRANYRWFNYSVGDYPLPEGVRVEDLGKNAKLVIRLNDESRTTAMRKHRAEPYEIGLIEDPVNPGCYIPMYDHWSGGFGLSDVVGEPVFDESGQLTMLCPKLKQFYDMCCDSRAATGCGDRITFMNLKEAHEKHPNLFPQATDDVDTWVSIVDTDQRVQATL